VRAVIAGVLASALSAGCAPTARPATRVARVLQVTPTGDRAADAAFERVRSLQIALNESERDYLEALEALAARISPRQDAELASLAGALRARADALFAQGKALSLTLDTTAAEAMMAHPDANAGCDGFAQPANVHRCQVELARSVVATLEERPSSRPAPTDEEEEEVTRRWPETREDFALATCVALGELSAIRLRLRAIARSADSVKLELTRARLGPSHREELRDAMEFLDGLSSRSRVQSRFATTAAETLANSVQRIVR
jgi:hypothetical protein